MEHKLLIHLILKRKFGFGSWPIKKALQHKTIGLGVLIENIDDKPFSGATLSSMKFGSTYNNVAVHFNSRNEFNIKLLNPNEKTKIWLDGFTPLIDGSYNFEFKLSPKNQEDVILVSEYDKFNKCPATPLTNEFFTTFYVQNSTDNILVGTNILLTIIAILTLLLAVLALLK